MTILKIKLLLDEPGFFRETRVGAWIHVLDYETGKGEWKYEPENKTCFCGHRLENHHRGARQCWHCPCIRFRPFTSRSPLQPEDIESLPAPFAGSVRRSQVPSMPG